MQNLSRTNVAGVMVGSPFVLDDPLHTSGELLFIRHNDNGLRGLRRPPGNLDSGLVRDMGVGERSCSPTIKLGG